MNVYITKKNVVKWVVCVDIVPTVITMVMILQWNSNNTTLMTIIVGIIWLIAIIVNVLLFKEASGNPYPLSYLVDYDTLIRYMKEEEKVSLDNSLEAGFHYYLYSNNEKNEVQAWYHTFSNDESEKAKGNIYYWNKEEFNSLENLVENKIQRYEGHILIELIDSDNVMLNEYRSSHPELNVVNYIENLPKRL